MTSSEEIVKRRYPNACYTKVLSSPDDRRIGMIVIESKWRAGDELGIGMTPEEAWSVAAIRLNSICPDCGCLKTSHYGPKVGCEGLGGNCGCKNLFS